MVEIFNCSCLCLAPFKPVLPPDFLVMHAAGPHPNRAGHTCHRPIHLVSFILGQIWRSHSGPLFGPIYGPTWQYLWRLNIVFLPCGTWCEDQFLKLLPPVSFFLPWVASLPLHGLPVLTCAMRVKKQKKQTREKKINLKHNITESEEQSGEI